MANHIIASPMTSEATPSVNPEASSWNLRRLRSAITAASATVTPKTIARGTIENFPAFRDRSEVDWGNMAGWLREVRLPPPGVSRLSRRLQRALAAALRARLRLPPPLTGLVTANPRAQQPCSCLARVPGPGLSGAYHPQRRGSLATERGPSEGRVMLGRYEVRHARDLGGPLSWLGSAVWWLDRGSAYAAMPSLARLAPP